jgi:hypothetical protein
MTAKDDDMMARFEAVLAEKEAELEAAKKKKTNAVDVAMKNGGGAVAGGLLGVAIAAPAAVWVAGALAAPFTGGLSVAAAAAVTAAAVAGSAVVGHKMAKDVD